MHVASLSTQIFGEETRAQRATCVCVCGLRVYARVRVYYEQEQLAQLGALLARQRCLPLEWSVRARGTPGISVCREYMTVYV